MSSSDRDRGPARWPVRLLTLMTPFLALFTPLAGQQPARLTAVSGALSPRLAARVAEAVARSWAVDTTGLVLSWGSGALGDLPDASGFRLLGNGDGGWYAVTFEPRGRPPVAVRLRVGVTVPRLVAARALRPGMTLVEGDLRAEPHVQWGPPLADLAPRPAAGWLVRRAVAAGEALVPPRVAPPPVIAAGQPVRVHWSEGNVSVALEGTALNDAVVGETVRVRTGRRTGVLIGTVVAPGEARMP
jgi:flagella basal body P-ring formation protein FlgA